MRPRVVDAYDGHMDARRLARPTPSPRPSSRWPASWGSTCATPTTCAGSALARRADRRGHDSRRKQAPAATDARPQRRPRAAAAAGRGVRARRKARARGASTTATRWPRRPDRRGAPRGRRDGARAVRRSCCSTSTRTPATPSSSCCESLFGGGHPVMAVGDPCQSIYGWRGASAGNLAAVRRDFPRRATARRADAAAVDELPQRRAGPGRRPPASRRELRAGGQGRAAAARPPARAAARAAASSAGCSRPSRRRPTGWPSASPACCGSRTDSRRTASPAGRPAGTAVQPSDIAVLARKRVAVPADAGGAGGPRRPGRGGRPRRAADRPRGAGRRRDAARCCTIRRPGRRWPGCSPARAGGSARATSSPSAAGPATSPARRRDGPGPAGPSREPGAGARHGHGPEERGAPLAAGDAADPLAGWSRS